MQHALQKNKTKQNTTKQQPLHVLHIKQQKNPNQKPNQKPKNGRNSPSSHHNEEVRQELLTTTESNTAK